IATCVKHKCHQFIFSSTAAVYGMTGEGAASEETPTLPINPYGHSKLMTEQMLKDVAFSSPLRFVALRYFNVSGADPEGEIGQSFPGATHLIKVACETACGKRDHIKVFGTDYPTPDGTCVRDFIHVSDLADAHVKALDYLTKGGKSEILNCGYGHGFSVKEVLTKVRQITGVNIKAEETPRRPGDPAMVMSKADKIRSILGWKPQYDDLDLIIRSAYEWEKKGRY
nr:UDP-glucose 4-epimerase GalE [Bdellovibrionales bacterium]